LGGNGYVKKLGWMTSKPGQQLGHEKKKIKKIGYLEYKEKNAV
jgi:hypothetical protein